MATLEEFKIKIGVLQERIGTTCRVTGDVDEELTSRITRWMQQFGFSSSPPADTEITIVEADAGPTVIASDHTDGEPDLAPGWSAQYDIGGNVVKLMNEDGIEITAADGALTVTSNTDDLSLLSLLTNHVVIKSTGTGLVKLGRGALRKVARNTDTVVAAGGVGGMTAWMTTVSAAIPGGPIALPTSFGTISGGSADVYAGD